MSSDTAIDVNTAAGAYPWWRHEDYVSMTMEFRCNLKCVHCMIEGTMDWLDKQDTDQFEQVLAENRATGRWKGLVLTGSEVTLNKDLPRWAEQARGAGFEHIRIQTHGVHLANPQYCARLIDAGIDEYFISVTAADAETHDRITVRKGAFDKMMRGFENLDRHDVLVLTNTVITTHSYQQLPDVVDALARFRNLRQMEFWNFFPMEEEDKKDLVVRYADLLPPLTAAIDKAAALGRRVEVKNVPHCLLGAHGRYLENDQPQLLIDERFWGEFARNGFDVCAYRDQCASDKCLGVNEAYAKKFGWEHDLLTPIG